MLSASATSRAKAGPTFAAVVMMAISSGSIYLYRHCSRGETGGAGGKMVTAKNFAS
ncbi:hypothetical protein [Rhizobium leguminosarum]|uniref:hypothetical protein n=1 Tax=Rhizobium leguminosarum TaxID=384 RepID=UPI00140F8BC9|nr:hypothetical protein [Rhizobium leguminosarum]NZD50264.1 hypothetical protein [Rhizobium leguminosarum]QIO55040.1 hypothetical protein HA461_28750 [Rhizobium leguminosarum bv. trifolii]QND17720.1 hypothetical protein HB775_29795 [Rhizobium leguminosarum bv. trifolii]